MYSTCSINPIEDEAVVTEALRRALPNSLELVDCHSRLPGIYNPILLLFLILILFLIFRIQRKTWVI